MKIPSSPSSSLAPDSAPAAPARSTSTPPTDAAHATERRHHGGSADFLRRIARVEQAAPVPLAANPPGASSLGTLVHALCTALQGRRPQEQLAELLPAGWYAAPEQHDAEVSVQHAWPFTAGDCMVSAARMHRGTRDGALQQLYLGLAGEPLDVSLMEQQFGKMQASPAYSDGGPGDVLFSCPQPWGRLGVVADATGTTARALLLQPKAHESGR